ncbi:MAG: hypothetical protein RLZZ505_930 [Verrucomicrobiota bacterium]|jgi:hypothetical protein
MTRLSLIAVSLASCSLPLSACPDKEQVGDVSAAFPVKVSRSGMTRGGKPYFVQGVGGDKRLPELAERGGNSIRTWATTGLDKILDEAHSLNLTVSAGIWLESECSWFSYKNPEHLAKQAERVRKEVMQYKDHPALLAWGIGNESEGDGTDTPYWQQLDRLAVLVKETDPNHPTFTACAGLSPAKAKALNEHAPNLDFVGVNTYGGVFSLRNHLDKVGWTRPWMLTEWGPQGFWESRKTAFGAPLEQTSSEKAEMMRAAYKKVLAPEGGCLGNYAFVWSWKFEATATWFGLYTYDGETTAAVDVLEEMWTGRPPANRAPSITPINGIPQAAIAPGTAFHATAAASDPENDPLTWQWAILPELQGHQHNTSGTMPPFIQQFIANPMEHAVTVSAPEKPGVYRLYVWVKDGKGQAATANHPFKVH